LAKKAKGASINIKEGNTVIQKEEEEREIEREEEREEERGNPNAVVSEDLYRNP